MSTSLPIHSGPSGSGESRTSRGETTALSQDTLGDRLYQFVKELSRQDLKSTKVLVRFTDNKHRGPNTREFPLTDAMSENILAIVNNHKSLDGLNQMMDSVAQSKTSDDLETSLEEQEQYILWQIQRWETLERECVLLRNFYDSVKKTQDEIESPELHAQAEVSGLFPKTGAPRFTIERRIKLNSLEMYYRDHASNLFRKLPEMLESLRDAGEMGIRYDQSPYGRSRYIARDLVLLQDSRPREITTQIRKDFKKEAAIECYGAKVGWGLRCSATGHVFPREKVLCAHIVPATTSAEVAAYFFGESSGTEILNSPRNILLVHHKVEKAMDLGRVTFVPVDGEEQTDGAPTDFRMQILDESLLDTRFMEEDKEGNDITMTWKEFLGCNKLVFGSEQRPGKRNLYHHSISSMITAKRKSYIGWENTWNAFCKGSVWATPGRYLRQSQLLQLTRDAGLPIVGKVNLGVFKESPRSPSKTRFVEKQFSRELLQGADNAFKIRARKEMLQGLGSNEAEDDEIMDPSMDPPSGSLRLPDGTGERGPLSTPDIDEMPEEEQESRRPSITI